MSILREADRFVVYCDGQDCNKSFVGNEDFRETVDGIKDEEWKVVKGNVGWLHYCPDCKT